MPRYEIELSPADVTELLAAVEDTDPDPETGLRITPRNFIVETVQSRLADNRMRRLFPYTEGGEL